MFNFIFRWSMTLLIDGHRLIVRVEVGFRTENVISLALAMPVINSFLSSKPRHVVFTSSTYFLGKEVEHIDNDSICPIYEVPSWCAIRSVDSLNSGIIFAQMEGSCLQTCTCTSIREPDSPTAIFWEQIYSSWLFSPPIWMHYKRQVQEALGCKYLGSKGSRLGSACDDETDSSYRDSESDYLIVSIHTYRPYIVAYRYWLHVHNGVMNLSFEAKNWSGSFVQVGEESHLQKG